ncbi:Homeodomain-like protein [Cordyceps fumosorosea ARSEF 2679]|uniref:Homeodomain-like protein n=1 Tax=Cordyceps fumosorosea (strain ARSEF 2679) TaxID=1081104 RepID=A0A168EJL1_CORFA|nr:Homeodomain-like protein [Cordyceps fumosorosea ARSEF 2679]OAA73891.1 Homeodomain-like protein [Cordyceps fumosorosea ARSEF 2679]
MELDYTSQANTGSTDSVLMTPRNINAVCKQESPAAADTMASIPDRGDDGKVSKVGAGISRTAPSSEDAQRAAATLLNYLQNLGQSGQFDHEYSAIMQLTRKLDIQPRHFAQHGTGGLARIVEGEVDLITAGGGRGN